MCGVQDFIDNLPPMPDFKLRYAPSPLREGLRQFPPQHRMRVFRVLTAWSIRVCSPNYPPLPPGSFLLAVPVAGGCWAATFDPRRLWNETPATPGAEAVAFDLLNRSYGRKPDSRELLHTIARAIIDAPNLRDFLTRAIERGEHTCVFVGALGAGRGQHRRLGALAVPAAPREPLHGQLASGVAVPPYARAIYDGAIGRRCNGPTFQNVGPPPLTEPEEPVATNVVKLRRGRPDRGTCGSPPSPRL